MRAPALLATLALVAACGARELEYRESPGGGGAGTGGSAGAGGTGAASGGGGAGGFGGAAYSNAVAKLSPAAYYRFDEKSGTDFASEVDANLGQALADGGTSVLAGQPGAVDGGSSVQLLGGATGAIDFGDAFDFVGLAPFSIALFVKVVSYKTGASNLLTKYAGSGDGWRTEVDSLKGVGFHLYVSDTPTPHWTSTLMAVEQTWTFLAFTRTATHLCSYSASKVAPTLLDVCVQKGATLNNTSAALRLGGGLEAYVDELAIFTSALTKAEIDGLWETALNSGVP